MRTAAEPSLGRVTSGRPCLPLHAPRLHPVYIVKTHVHTHTNTHQCNHWRMPTRRTLQVLEGASARSKAAMRAGREPGCLLDFWSQQINAECDVSGRVVGMSAVQGLR
jgi:hypothetical protein